MHGTFWAAVSSTREAAAGDFARQVELLEALRDGEFDAAWRASLGAAASRELWDAAVLLQGWIGVDTFTDFRGWLIAKGEVTFVAALADADSVAALNNQKYQLDLAATARLREFSTDRTAENDLTGEWTNLSDDRAVKARFPRLAGLVDARRCR